MDAEPCATWFRGCGYEDPVTENESPSYAVRLGLPPFRNVTGQWFGKNGERITLEEGQYWLANPDLTIVATDKIGTDRSPAGVRTIFAPFDMSPSFDGKTPPYIYATAVWYVRRRLWRSPVLYADWEILTQTPMAAQSAHDQAIAHVRAQIRRYSRLRWRIPWLPAVVVALAVIGLGSVLAGALSAVSGALR
jgi:hypothetical protein